MNKDAIYNELLGSFLKKYKEADLEAVIREASKTAPSGLLTENINTQVSIFLITLALESVAERLEMMSQAS